MAILVPTCCQDVPNLTPRSPKRARLVVKIAQNTPQEPPTRPPKTPKYSKNVVLSFDFRLSPFFNRSLPRLPKMLKIAPQMPSRWPSWHQLGASWRHLGPNLAPSWAIWATFGSKIDQNRPRQLLKDLSSRGRPQELPDPLQTSIFQVFRIIF